MKQEVGSDGGDKVVGGLVMENREGIKGAGGDAEDGANEFDFECSCCCCVYFCLNSAADAGDSGGGKTILNDSSTPPLSQ